MIALDKLEKTLIFKGFRKMLNAEFGEAEASQIWQEANRYLLEFERKHPDITGDNKMMILPSAALYLALRNHAPGQALPLMCAYGTKIGEQIAGIIHGITSIPGVSTLLWKNAPRLMRNSSSPEKGYTRRIVSETAELVGVDILSCPLHDAAVKIGVPEAALMVCAMDKAYMTGFRHIRYTRTTSVAEGAECCDYRLSYDKNHI